MRISLCPFHKGVGHRDSRGALGAPYPPFLVPPPPLRICHKGVTPVKHQNPNITVECTSKLPPRTCPCPFCPRRDRRELNTHWPIGTLPRVLSREPHCETLPLLRGGWNGPPSPAQANPHPPCARGHIGRMHAHPQMPPGGTGYTSTSLRHPPRRHIFPPFQRGSSEVESLCGYT